MNAGRDIRIRVSADIHFRQFDDEGILLDLQKGEYYSLNAVATRMWKALADGKSPQEIATEFGPDYAIDPEVLLKDCIDLVDALVTRRFVRPRTEP